MASKAVRLKSNVPKAVFTVDQLFAAAFGPEPIEYHNKSLLGWRPVAMSPDGFPYGVQKQSSAVGASSAESQSGVKVYETDSLIVVEVELPAIDEDSLYLEISGYMLIIRGTQLPLEAPNRPHAAKRIEKAVHRCVQLPVIARPGQVRARLEGNVVRVMIRKRLPSE